MREKVLLFMKLTGFENTIEPLIEDITGQFRVKDSDKWETVGDGEIPGRHEAAACQPSHGRGP